MSADSLLSFLKPQLGREIHVGSWLTITQERVDRFAEVTGDVQWIHTDPERAAKESPYRATIAHGYLTLSLLPCLTESNHPDFFQKNYPGMKLRVNYGVNKVRFPSPVLVGSRIRARTLLERAERVGEAVQISYRITVEIEGNDKPACVAESLVRVYP
ncbi:MaoC family dehydratase [Trichloromonas sp.]|uniref:MaoC family dehydratase n=1 Tax=Trichloromonas sp. TaxID=3069249 RepID=UPI003D817A78